MVHKEEYTDPEDSEEENETDDDEEEQADEDMDTDGESNETELSDDDDEGGEEGTDLDVWMMMKNEAQQSNMTILELYKENILFHRRLKRSTIHQAIMKTMNRVKEEDDMSFSEALDYAIDKRKFLILQSVEIEN